MVDDSQPVSGDIDVCDTLPLFLEDWGIHEECLPAEPKPDAAPLVFTSGPVDVPDTQALPILLHMAVNLLPLIPVRDLSRSLARFHPYQSLKPSKPDESTVP